MSDEPSMTAEQWHQLADERSAEIVRLQTTIERFQHTVSSLTQDLERERRDHRRTARYFRMLQECNIRLEQRFEKLGDLCQQWTDDDDAKVPGPVRQCGEALGELLHGPYDSTTLPYQDAVHASFYFRDPERTDGMFDALPGDGFGFVGATESKLSLQFDCAGVMACSDLPYETLRPLLAKEGLALVPLVTVTPLEQYAFQDSLIHGHRDRIEQLEKELGWAKRDVEIGNEIADELRQGSERLEMQLEKVESMLAERAEKGAELQRKLDFCEKLTEQIATLEDRRVLDAVAALPVRVLRHMSSQIGVGTGPKLDHLVSFELARRIARADLDLPPDPRFDNAARLIETPHDELFAQLERAEAEGKRAAAMTPEEREARFEAYLREHGYLKPGEQLAKRKGETDV